MEGFVKVAITADLPSGNLMLVEVEDERIVLANVDGQYYALADACTHADCPLSNGELEGAVLECSCHGSQFDVRTGEVVSPPADEPLARYAVRIEGDDILVGPGG